MDDDPRVLNDVKNALEEQLPVEVAAVSSSDIAMQLVNKRSSRFSAYILDIEMAGQKYSGIQVAEAVRQMPGCALVPILFLTSHAHFAGGGLKNIHYYDFFQKPCDLSRLIRSLRSALSLDDDPQDRPKPPSILIESNHLFFELDPSEVSSIEIAGTELLVTDLLGHVTTYPVKPHTFSKICSALAANEGHTLCQIHRSVIINLNRIRRIEWRKNSATVWLFNVSDWKPVGKTYLNKLSAYNKQPSVN